MAEKLLKKQLLGEAFENLTNGVIFIKYGSWGKPKPRHVFMYNQHICWREPNDMTAPVLPVIPKPPKKDKIK